MKDPIELDPTKRYKMLFMFQSASMRFAGIVQPVCVAYSSDGVHWNVPKYWLNPVIPEGSDTHLVAYWDPNLHKYVVYLRGRPNVRIICMSESDDFESWTPREIIVQPDAQDPPQDREFYGMSSLAYRDFRIGFLSVFHTLNEGWIAQNQIEPWMPEWMNQMDVQLTYSKDGRTWHRAGARERILVCGPRGSFDSGCVYPPHAPFVRGEEIWVYYGGSNDLHGEPPRHGEPTRPRDKSGEDSEGSIGLFKSGERGACDHDISQHQAGFIVDKRRCYGRVIAGGTGRSIRQGNPWLFQR